MIRLLLALLVCALALPAAAQPVCHAPAAPVAMTQHGGHGQPQHVPVLAKHACIGCIPPASSGARVAAPALAPAMPVAVVVARLDLGGGVPPALPPPRTD